VFHSNYGSILLHFQDMTIRWTTDDGWTTDGRGTDDGLMSATIIYI